MSDEFVDYINDNTTTWLRHYGVFYGAGAGWHFCFAGFSYSPASKLRLYVWGLPFRVPSFPHQHTGDGLSDSSESSYYRPSTEQFWGGNSQTQQPFNNIKDFAANSGVFCCDDGTAWVASGGSQTQLNRLTNRLALGTVSEQKFNERNLTEDEETYFGTRNTPQRRDTCTRIIGKTGEFFDTHIVAVASGGDGQSRTVFVDDAGDVWFSGADITANQFFDAVAPLESVSGKLGFPTLVQFFEYESPSGLVQLEESIHFVDAGFYDILDRFCGLTNDGKILLWGGFKDSAFQEKLYEMAGFVSSVTTTNSGSGYASNPTLTVSDPDHPDGVKPAFTFSLSNGSVTGLRITDGGWGYETAPTLTFSAPGGNGTTATASCSLFDNTWTKLCNKKGFGAIASIDSDNNLFLCRNDLSSGPIKPQNHSGSGYSDAKQGSSFVGGGGSLLLLTTGGTLEVFNVNTSNGQRDSSADRKIYSITATGLSFSHIAATGDDADDNFACLSTSGDLYYIGTTFEYNPTQGNGFPSDETSASVNYWQFSPALIEGDAKWTRVFGGNAGFVACRDESFDAHGNRIDPISPGLT